MSLQNLKINLLKLQNILEDHEGVEMSVHIKNEHLIMTIKYKSNTFSSSFCPEEIKTITLWHKNDANLLSDAILGTLGYIKS